MSTAAFARPVDAAVGNPVVTLGNVPGPSGGAIETGTAVFDGQGECGATAPAAPPVPFPGNDCGPGDNVVRTNDLVNYGYSVGVSNLLGASDPGGPEHVDDIYFTQTITPATPDATVEFPSVPPACRTGANPDTGNPYDPQSEIISLPGGASQLVCNVGRLSGPSQTLFLQTKVRVDGTSKNNSAFSSTDTFCEGAPAPAAGCTPVSDRTDVTGVDASDITPDVETFVSAAPQFDLAKNRYGPNNAGIVTHPTTGELGYLYRFYPTIEVDATADGKGSSALDGDITFEDMMYVTGTTTPIPGFEMHPTSTVDCYWNNHSGRPIPYGQTGYGPNDNRNVADTGTVGCTQAAPGAPIEITLTGTDTTGNHFPEYGSNGVTALQPPYYVAALYQYIWVPFDVIDRYDAAATCDGAATAAGFTAPFCGDLDDTGTLPITNCLEAFDPTALDANGNPVSNYGAGVEPGVYGAGTGNNNCKNTSMTLTNRGGASKYYNLKVVDGGWVGGVPAGQTSYHTGDGPLEPNQNIAVASRFYNNGTFPFTGGALCEKVDTMTQTLIPIQTNAAWVPVDGAGRNLPVEIHMTGGAYDPALLVVEYASGPAGTAPTGFVQWDNDHLVGGLNPLTGLYDGSTFATQKATNCSDASGNWTTDPYSFDADEQTSLQNIRSVRARYLGTMAPGQDIRMGIELQMLNTFNGGPYDGQIIPAGVLLPNFIAYKSDQLNGGDWRDSTYDPNTDASYSGDRMISSRGYVRVAKTIVPYNTNHALVDPADYTNVDNGLAGDPFQFRLLPAVRSNITSGAALTDVTVTDVLPSWLIYDPVCTAAVSAWPPPVVQNNTPTAGETTLIWSLGTVLPNGNLDPIDFCVDTSPLAPDGTNALNTVVISANEDVSTERQRKATATVVLNQVGKFQVLKSVDSPLDPQDNSQLFTLDWLNSSDFVTLDAPIIVDVFPHDLDEVGEGSLAPRNPGSEFNGTTVLSGSATSSTTGDFYYTKADAFIVSNNPAHPSNPFAVAPFDASNPNLGPLADANDDGTSDVGTTIWCLEADFGTTGCPGALSDSTGLMFVGDDTIDPGENASVQFPMQATGNDPGDVYANSFGGFTPSLPGQLSISNTVTVRVGGLLLGDLIWFDYNDNGIYEPALGEIPVPDGVTVELLDGTLAPLGISTTTLNGRYVFDHLDPGFYAVRIPAANFAAGAPLENLRPSTPVGLPDADGNETTDQNGIASGGAVVTDPIELTWTTVGPDADGNIDIVGDEPLGDDVAALRVTIDDSLHNMTLDIGLVGDPDLTIVKSVNGDDANTVPGIYVAPGDAVTWTYEVENTGDITLNNVTIVDDQGVTVVCPALHSDAGGDNIIDALFVGESLTCTGSGIAVAGGYTNVGTATATPPSGTSFDVEDPANYFGVAPAIDIEKSTNTIDADAPNGPLIPQNGTVTWTYEVENSGNTALTDVAVTDDIVAAADISCASHLGDADGNNVIALMLPGDVVICTATGTAIAAQYANTGDVSGTPVVPTSPSATFDPDDPSTYPTDPSDFSDAGLVDVDDTDDSHYFGTNPSVVIEKTTNGVDSDVAPGEFLTAGDAVTWTYEVRNDGNVPLLDVTVTDDVVAATQIECENYLGDVDGNNVIALMLPGDVLICKASGSAIAGQYANTGSVAGTPIFPTKPGDYDPANPASWPTDPADYDKTGDAPEVDADPSHYFGAKSGIDIEKSTNTIDADATNGPLIPDGDTVTWTYEVRNRGNTALLKVEVLDDLVAGTDIVCKDHLDDTDGDNNIAVLLPGDLVICTATGTAIAGQYENNGSVNGTPAFPTTPGPTFDPLDPATWPTSIDDFSPTGESSLDDADPSHYFGTTPSIIIEKSTNTIDSDVAPGEFVAIGDAITWTYEVRNDGNVPLSDVTVLDNVVAATDISCATHLGDSDGNNVISLLLPSDVVECTATGTATAGQYANIGRVAGDPVFPTASGDYDPADPASWPTDPADYTDTGDSAQRADDPSHYFAAASAIDVEKSTNTIDADNPNGPLVEENGTVTWAYVVRNQGNTALTDVTVLDDVVAAADISCATHLGDSDGNNVIALMLPGDVVTCTATGTATAGQYANTGSVSGDPVYPTDPSSTPGFDPTDPSTWPTDPAAFSPTGEPAPTDSDDSHYFGTNPSIDIEKSTNTVDADVATGPFVALGDVVTWTYDVENTGTLPLLDVTVTDDIVAAADISCATHLGDADANNVIALMLPGDVVTCTATGTATAGQYANTGSVSGDPVFPTAPGAYDAADPTSWPVDPADYGDSGDAAVTDTDDSHYFGPSPAVVIEKDTNGADADSVPGPVVEIGDAVTWTFEVENTGNTALSNVTVTDDIVASADISCATHLGDSDGNNVIAFMLPNDVVECTATGLAIAGQYANTGSVTGDSVYPTDPSSTPGFDPTDPSTWPTDPTVFGPTGAPAPVDTDDSHYFGGSAGITVEKSTNGDDADTPTGPYVPESGDVSWTYEITNTGNAALLDVVVIDDQLDAADVSCATHRGDVDGNNVIALMLPNDVVECTASGSATAGQYQNNVAVTGDPATPDPATCSCDLSDPTTWPQDDPTEYVAVPDVTAPSAGDPSHYFGTDSSLTLEKATNGIDADTPTGPNVPVGSTVTWTYTVENTGNTPLTDVTVTDDVVDAADISCATHRGDGDGDNVIALVLPTDVVVCTATGIAIAGQYANVGDAVGQPAFPTAPGPDFDPADPATYPTDPGGYDDVVDPVTGSSVPAETATDPSHYFGADGSIDVEKSTNGDDADVATGPWVLEGDTVTWTYVITNDSNTSLAGVTLIDDQIAAEDIVCETYLDDLDGDTTIALLLPGASVTCTASAPASVAGQYVNNASTSGQPVFPTTPGPDFDPTDPATWPTDPADYGDVVDPSTGLSIPPATDLDPSHYWGTTSSIDINKLVSSTGQDGVDQDSVDEDSAPGAQLDNGDAVTWTFVVTNTGSAPQTNVVVGDDDTTVTVDCGGSNTIALLLPGQVVECQATSTVEAGAYVNIGSVSGQPSFPNTDDPSFDPTDPATWPTDPAEYGPIIDPATSAPTAPDTDSDPSHHFGNGAAIELVKEVCVIDSGSTCDPADDSHWADDAIHHDGMTESWRITVRNTGNVVLSDVAVSDPAIASCDTAIGDLAPGAVIVITCDGDPGVAPSSNTASVTATGPSGRVVDAVDTATLRPPPELKVDKVVADDTLAIGAIANFTVTVTNIGRGPATMTELVDQLPAGLEFIAVATSGSTTRFDAATRTLTWSIGDLPAGESVSLVYSARVGARGGSLTNTAVVSSAELEAAGTLADNTDTAVVRVASAPVIAFTGSSSTTMASIAAMLMVAGAALLMIRRRRFAE